MKCCDINDVEQQLNIFETAAFLTKGASMRPLLKTNRDIVVITKPSFPLKVGEVALYKKASSDKLVLHRVIALRADGGYITRGDNTYHKEYVDQKDIVGVMTELYRKGKYINCGESKCYRLYVGLNKFFYPARWLWYTKIRAVLAAVKHKILPLMMILCLLTGTVACKNEKSDAVNTNSVTDTSSELVSTEQPIASTPQYTTPPSDISTNKTVAVTGELSGENYSQKIDELQSVLNGYTRNVSLAVYSIDGSKGLYYNTDAEIFGACTVKAAYTLYACKQMESGNGSLQTEMVYEQKHYEPGTGDMQYSPFGSVFTMETALSKSMSISDNVGYLMAVDYFGRDGYNDFINDLGCPSLAIKPTVWSLYTKAVDLVKVWCEIYNYFETDSEYARFMYNSCTNTAGNYITASLQDVEYSHKQGHNSTGDWLSLSDAGIVWKSDNPYIIAILTDAAGPSAYDAEVFEKIINIVHNDLF